jgi:chromosome segregation ATPase
MESSTSDALEQLQKKYDNLTAELQAARSTHATELEATKRDVNEQQTLYRELLSRQDQAPTDIEKPTQDTTHLEDQLRQLSRERDEAIRRSEEAEDQIEVMKEEVVRKHLALIEPVEKENVSLKEKISRLEAIIKAGDRIARAAATIGEKRQINTLTEEVAESSSSEEDRPKDEDTTAGGQAPAPVKINGIPVPNDVIGTVS